MNTKHDPAEARESIGRKLASYHAAVEKAGGLSGHGDVGGSPPGTKYQGTTALATEDEKPPKPKDAG